VPDAIGAVRFGAREPFTLGVEEELILVDGRDRELSHRGADVLGRMQVAAEEGSAHPDTYAALVELATPITRAAPEAADRLATLRDRVRAAGGTAMGAGLHPTGGFGDVVHVQAPRYAEIVAQVRGLITRTPTCAVHVHVGMPDAETAIRVCNAMREHLPLLQALAANSPFWHGLDSGLASARAQVFRGYPRAEIPRAFDSYADYAETVHAVVAAGELADYTFLWWDVRPSPRLGTVELRAMDAQAPLWSTVGLAGLVHGLARAAAETPATTLTSREALMESSFIAARDGLEARLPLDGALRPAREVARAAIERARPWARDLGSEPALELVERILREGNGADRQRAAYARGGMPAVLDLLVAETGAAFSVRG
jgi:glutamate---cysteine ligase / carboxylate-amine ligase